MVKKAYKDSADNTYMSPKTLQYTLNASERHVCPLTTVYGTIFSMYQGSNSLKFNIRIKDICITIYCSIDKAVGIGSRCICPRPF